MLITSRRAAAILLTALLVAAMSSRATADPPAPHRVPVGGGTGIGFTHGVPTDGPFFGYQCTLTTIGYDAAGNLVGITNAHCEYDNFGQQWLGDQVFLAEPPGVPEPLDLTTGVIGTIVYISGGNPLFPGPNGIGLDYAVIEFDKAKVDPTATVNGTTIARIGPLPPAGTPICKQGRLTALTCGLVLTDAPPYFVTTIPLWQTDSGAPVLAGNTLIGTLWSLAATAITPILSDLDRRGGIGAGFTPIPP